MAPVLRLAGVRKRYQSLRPLRLNGLTVAAGERVSISGLDAGAAEVLVNLVTGASLPDEGSIEIGGDATNAIVDGDAWLASLDRFGIVTPRAVLLDAVSVLQNLAMPFTLQIDPVPPETAAKAAELARDAGIPPAALPRPIAGAAADLLMRVHLARAAALSPALLILEHPTASLAPGQSEAFGVSVAQIASRRQLTVVMISDDDAFTRAAATRRLALNPATGEVKAPRRRLFGS